MTAEEVLEWVRGEILSLCEATENDERLAERSLPRCAVGEVS